MSVMKRTYALPEETVRQFEHVVPPGRRSALLASLLNAWIQEQRRAALAQAVVEGCHAMADTYQEMEQAFHALEEEVSDGALNPIPSR